MEVPAFVYFLDMQSVMTHPTIGNSSTNSVAHLINDRSNESTKTLGVVSL